MHGCIHISTKVLFLGRSDTCVLLKAMKSMEAAASWEVEADQKARVMQQVRAHEAVAAQQKAAEQERRQQLAMQQAQEEAQHAEALYNSQVRLAVISTTTRLARGRLWLPRPFAAPAACVDPQLLPAALPAVSCQTRA